MNGKEEENAMEKYFFNLLGLGVFMQTQEAAKTIFVSLSFFSTMENTNLINHYECNML